MAASNDYLLPLASYLWMGTEDLLLRDHTEGGGWHSEGRTGRSDLYATVARHVCISYQKTRTHITPEATHELSTHDRMASSQPQSCSRTRYIPTTSPASLHQSFSHLASVYILFFLFPLSGDMLKHTMMGGRKSPACWCKSHIRHHQPGNASVLGTWWYHRAGSPSDIPVCALYRD